MQWQALGRMGLGVSPPVAVTLSVQVRPLGSWVTCYLSWAEVRNVAWNWAGHPGLSANGSWQEVPGLWASALAGYLSNSRYQAPGLGLFCEASSWVRSPRAGHPLYPRGVCVGGSFQDRQVLTWDEGAGSSLAPSQAAQDMSSPCDSWEGLGWPVVGVDTTPGPDPLSGLRAVLADTGGSGTLQNLSCEGQPMASGSTLQGTLTSETGQAPAAPVFG